MSDVAWLQSLRAGRGVCPLFGADAVVARFAEIVSVDRSERLVMVPASSQRPLLGMLPMPPDVRTRWLGSAPSSHDARLIAAGAEHRILSTLPAKMVIIDRAVVMTPIDPGDPLKGVWQITAKPLVRALVEMYQRLWGQAAKPVRWPAGLSARERAVVTLLAEGCTDQMVAEQLGLSRRTITYTVADLMEKYGARSRFQLALLLGGVADGSHQRA
ncbi:helix-turn-helix transcriptional regulator [Nonomuraea aurantiaca]|jgi:DNA-binding CsgD family transcriptional regulator|uniref:helix-turn-helix transcriptional regulator n=1 Tax=Nonomuraea aurantiaca TaxID=2878562 RepID=UPI001CD918F3|nr:helix-turn-helix transcriptional regulator [Nonomuraea aurantiaca]MCA2226047.1 helix-turn-helix transcriptional regulator [Nonomuraea aurantiaca]